MLKNIIIILIIIILKSKKLNNLLKDLSKVLKDYLRTT